MRIGAACALVRSNPVGVKLGDELSEELNFRNSDCDPKGIANRNHKSQTQSVSVNREMADGYLRGKKISALKLLIVSSTRSPILIVNQQGTGIICRKIFFATLKLIYCDQFVERDRFMLRSTKEFLLGFATCAAVTVSRTLDSTEQLTKLRLR